MKSGKKVRQGVIAITAFISALFEHIGSILFDRLGVFDMFPANFVVVMNVGISAVIFVLVFCVLGLLVRSNWVRRVFFKEKIVEGTWFAVFSRDEDFETEYSCGIITTYYNDNDDFTYEATLFSLDGNFDEIAYIDSICSALTYNENGNKVIFDCAHNYTYYETEKNIRTEKKEAGYGKIVFISAKPSCNIHNGHFETTNNRVLRLTASLIHEKDLISKLSSDEKNDVLQVLLNKYRASHKHITQSEKMDDLYSKPEMYHQFTQKEDADKNLKKEILEKNNFNGKVVLDMGVGTGRFSKYIIENERVKKLICSDSSKDMLNFVSNSEFFKSSQDKIEIIHCDHLALATFIPEHTIDYIIAGYSIGTCYNDALLTREQKDLWLKQLIFTAEKILAPGGTMIIIETKGLGTLDRYELINFDSDLENCYRTIEAEGFELTLVDTSFKFDTKKEADEIISIVWGPNECRRSIQGEKWTLNEVSGVWVKTFT